MPTCVMRLAVQGLDRRTILGLLGAASSTTIAAVVPATPALAYDPGTTETKARYRETDHVKAFYRTNGYETLQKRE
jgi:hypothetical protein